MQENESIEPQEVMHKNVHVTLFPLAPKYESHKHPSTDTFMNFYVTVKRKVY